MNNFVSDINLTYSPKFKIKDLPRVKNSEEVAEVFRPYFKPFMQHREAFYIMCLNRNNKVLGVHLISIGGQSGTMVDPKLVFQTALLTNSASIVLAHNHPSGNKKPSYPDIEMTKKIVNGAKLLQIAVYDHIIMTEESYLSMNDDCIVNF